MPRVVEIVIVAAMTAPASVAAEKATGRETAQTVAAAGAAAVAAGPLLRGAVGEVMEGVVAEGTEDVAPPLVQDPAPLLAAAAAAAVTEGLVTGQGVLHQGKQIDSLPRLCFPHSPSFQPPFPLLCKLEIIDRPTRQTKSILGEYSKLNFATLQNTF